MRGTTMQNFTEGYVTAFPYTYGYYAELNPLRAMLPILRQGLAVPQIHTACELGFGQGLSINIHAAASETEWWGTDFNSSQVSFARSLGRASGANIHLCNEPFAEFCLRDDLPMFDFIGIHGIWSWINDANRKAIVELLKNRLAVGGILYISYNCHPGWAPMVPVRELLELYGARCGKSLENGIGEALEYASRLVDLDALYMKSQPGLQKRLDNLKNQNRAYLAHEYFNKSWDVMSFAKMAAWLAPAMLDYVCQASYLDNVNILNLSSGQQALLDGSDDIPLRETTRDFIRNTQFRRDYWIKGKMALPAFELRETILSLKFIMLAQRDAIELKARGSRAEANLDPGIYTPILNAFADHKAHKLSEFAHTMHEANISFPQLLEAITILCGKNALAPVNDINRNIFDHCKRLDGLIENWARSSSDIVFLASPLTGGGIQTDRFKQLFLLARRLGFRLPKDWAQFAWEQLAAVNQKIIKDGVPLESPEENLAELNIRADDFAGPQLSILEKLGIN